MIKLIKSKGLCLLLCITMLFTLVGCGIGKENQTTGALPTPTTSTVSDISADQINGEMNRANVQKQLPDVEKRYQQNPTDQALAFEYAQSLFQLGEFVTSGEILKPFLDGNAPSDETLYLLANVAHLTGNYVEAERLYNTLIKQSPDDFKTIAEMGLLFTYYQTNQYQKSVNLFKGLEDAIQQPMWEMMKAFGNEKPYQINWNGNQEAILPFISAENFYLPIVTVEVNGKPIKCFLDTGGDTFYMRESLATDLGIQSVAKDTGSYAGGLSATTHMGIAKSLGLDSITMKSVPVAFGPEDVFYSESVHLDGILGTNVLKEFLVTIDYPGNKLILRPRSEAGHQVLANDLQGHNKLTEMPFVLAATHLMIAKGSINGINDLNVFLDSGLNDKVSSLLLPKESMDFLNIPIPKLEKNTDPNRVGMAGGNFSSGNFNVDKFSVGSLNSNSAIGTYGIFPPDVYYDDFLGFFIDGLISHNFLKDYKWTIDYDAMKMTFSQ